MQTAGDATEKIIVPHALRGVFLHFFHDMPTAGHFGRQKTLYHLNQHCWWPNMYEDVQQHVAACHCRRTKNKEMPNTQSTITPNFFTVPKSNDQHRLSRTISYSG